MVWWPAWRAWSRCWQLFDGHGSPDLVIEVIWRAWWQPKPPLSCEIRGNGEPSCISTNFIKKCEKKANWFPDPHIFPLLTENLALLVREGNLRRKERTTPRYRSVFVTFLSFFATGLWQKVSAIRILSLFLLPFKHLYMCIYLFPLSYLLICCGSMWPFWSANLMGIGSQWKISNWPTVIPRVHIFPRQMENQR